MSDIAPPVTSIRRTLFAGALVAVSLFGDSYLYAVLPVRYEEVGIPLTAVGWMLSINRWIRFLTNPLAGQVGPRIGWGWAFAGALWLAAFTTAGYGWFKSAVLLILMRGLWGLCWSFLRLGGMAAVLIDSPQGSRGRLMGLFNGVFRLGSLVGVVLGGILADRLDFSRTAVIFGAATAAGALVASLPGAVSGRWGAPARNPEGLPGQTGLLSRWLPEGRDQLAACVSAGALHLVVSGVITATVGYMVRQRLGLEVTLGPWTVGAATFTGGLLGSRFALDLAVGPYIGLLGDRHGRARMLTLTTAILTIGTVALAWADSVWLITGVLVALFGAATGTAAVLDGWAGDLAGQTPGRFLSVYSTWTDVGAATGPLLGYYLMQWSGLGATYLAGASCLVLAFFLRLRLSTQLSS